jgi:hypothetical protein
MDPQSIAGVFAFPEQARLLAGQEMIRHSRWRIGRIWLGRNHGDVEPILVIGLQFPEPFGDGQAGGPGA